MFRLVTVIACFICVSISSVSAQQASTPFSIRNLNPFIQIYGIPATEPAELKTDQEWASAVALDVANSSILTRESNEAIILDGETYRLSLTMRRGINSKTELGVEVPLIAHSNGFMDNFIEGWHDTFGLTNAQRNKTTSNTLHYRYSVNNINVFEIDNPNEGIGDIRIFAARQLHRSANSALSVHTSLKLPTGDAEKLHGSGAADLSVSLAHIKRNWLTTLQLSSFANGGVLLLGKGDVLSHLQKSALLFGSTGLIWDQHEVIDLKAQLDFHSSVYNSGLNQLGNATVQLTIGGSVRLGSSTRLDVGIGENLLTDTTPDFLINLVLKSNY